MVVEVKAPVFSESVSQGALLAWHKNVGDRVERGDHLADIETDKVVLEVTALNAGVLKAIDKPVGAVVETGDLLATIDTAAAAAAPAAAPAAAAATTAGAATPAAAPAAAAATTAGAATLSPAVRKLVEETGANPAAIAGTGKDGRLTKGDVISHLEAPKPTAAPSAPLPAGARPEQRVPMTRIRARIAERLKQVQNTDALLTTFNEVNMKPIMDLRKQHQDAFTKKHGVKLGFMSFFVKAAAEALKQFPIVNASIDGNDIVYHGFFDIGIAVSTERGLVVPILRDADQMSLAEIEKTIGAYAEKARSNKLTMEDMTGGTFSITNGGTFGSMLSTPIVNAPQSAILGMHNIVERPVAENGQVVIRPIMYLALTYDHRIIDGKDSVQFLVAIKNMLEDPSRILLGI